MDWTRLILVKLKNVLAYFAFILGTRSTLPMHLRSLKVPLWPMHKELELDQHILSTSLNQKIDAVLPFRLAHCFRALLIKHLKKERAEGRFVNILKPNNTRVLQSESLCFGKYILNQLFNHNESIDPSQNLSGVSV